MYSMAISPDLTDYHAKYYAYELTRRYSADSLEKLASTFAGAKVDLNPQFSRTVCKTRWRNGYSRSQEKAQADLSSDIAPTGNCLCTVYPTSCYL
jgi:hypothetical protein